MLHLRSFTEFLIHLECWNACRFGQSNKFWKKSLDIQGWGLSRSSRGRPESTSKGRPLNVRLRRPLDVISGRPRDGQIGSLGDVLGTLEWDVLGTLEGDVLRTSWGLIFAGWDNANTIDTAIIRSSRLVVFCKTGVLKNFTKFTRKHLH